LTGPALHPATTRLAPAAKADTVTSLRSTGTCLLIS
jgi:hypothetical protein